MSTQIQQLTSLRDQLKSELGSAAPNLQKCNQFLIQSKIALAELGAFAPVAGHTDNNVLLIAREILETGAYYSVRVKDIASFERYIAQLNTFYHDLASVLPPSSQMYPLTGLNLLRLLSQNRLSDFHTALEVIDPEQLQTNQYIKQAVDLEQFLMEGSFNKVWSTRSTVQGEEFMFFYDILINTIRDEIASCSEKAYESLPLQDAGALLFIKNTAELLSFANKRGWKVNPGEQKICFGSDDSTAVEIPREQIISQTLSYARELERIV
ncbi:hypothetical protein DFQ28_011400 [Apophysomyces sp. BC1034]|nr:hypothetical protein DFQ30_004388 [Apophysomyces sp. BC1015]KAG0172859.1 hypothetical protein DFQ29_008203 [Apophysomyces sp. BC1021]KAG0191640.1 hypothetical protein DFQ28_011400 [Apophysomyces sp. BC1034]